MVYTKFDKDKMNSVTPTQDKSTGIADKPKKPFDKKRYRQQKYSNKYKVETWEKKRQKVLLRDLYTDLIQKKRGILVKASSPEDYAKNCNTEEPRSKPNSLLGARLEYKRRQNEVKRKKEEQMRAKAERHEALKKYKERRTETYKKLSRKTKKGQPVMKDRLELLLAKIQNET